jgi:hypothetical protein
MSHSTTATAICSGNWMFDWDSTLLFENAFQSSNRTLNSLELCGDDARFVKPTGTVLTNILGSTSSLKELKLTVGLCFNLTDSEIATIMEAVEQSPLLECLHMEDINTNVKCHAVAASLANVRWLKKFRFHLFDIDSRNRNGNVKRRLMRALRQNTSLEEVLYTRQNHFDNKEIATLAHYATMNKALPLLVASPDSVLRPNASSWCSHCRGTRLDLEQTAEIVSLNLRKFRCPPYHFPAQIK